MLIPSLSCVSADDAMANDTCEDFGISSDLDIQVDEVFYQGADDFNLSKGDDDVLAGNSVYFDASAESDGIGTSYSPYKYLTDDRLPSGVTAHFARGVYEVNESLLFYSGSGNWVNFIGENAQNTIIKSLNYNDFSVATASQFYALNLTFEGSHIVNKGIFLAENVIFKNSIDPNSYNITSDYSDYISSDEYGGAIFSGGSSDSTDYYLGLTNCYFENNKAISGGAIALYRSAAHINNCIFNVSSAPRLGGVIHCVRSQLVISKSEFESSYAGHGGSIYADASQIQINDSEFYNSQSYGFGGAVACNGTVLIVNSSNFTWSFSSADSGGAVYLHFSQSLIYDSLFYSNGAFYGGAVCSLKSFLNVSCCDFAENYAVYGGDGYVSYGQVNFEKSNFYNSDAHYGSSIYGMLTGYLSLSDNNFVNCTSSPVAVRYSTGRLDQSANTVDGASLAVEVYDGHIINIYGDGVASAVSYVPESQTVIPDRYDSRDYGYVTPVKNQKTGGNCWSFAGMAALEACLKKATGITFDFSEENAKNLMTEYSIFGVKGETNVEGGTGKMLMSYLASWLGPISDDKDIYDEYSQLASFYSPLFHIQNIYWVPNRANASDNDVYKKAIMDYGAVVVSVDTDDSSHAICLVGWDDSYRGYDFLNNTCTIGAWIFKNSWGPEWNDEGFGYLSYGNAFNSEVYGDTHSYTFIFNDTNSYDRIYQYDYAGVTTWYFFNETDDVIYYRNIFTAAEDGMLSAVSTYFEHPSDFVVSIYKGNASVLNQSGHCEMGYYTIPLDSQIRLDKGNEFTVQFKIISSYGATVPGCDVSEVTWQTFRQGISFISSNAEYWIDAYNDGTGGVACIKAFTTPINLTAVSISVNEFSTAAVGEEVSINVNFNGQNDDLDGSLVTVLINDRPYYALVENNHACLNVAFESEGTYSLSAYYKNNKYESNVVGFDFTVNDELTIRASDVVMYYGKSQQYTVLVTQNGVPVSAFVKIAVNGQTYTVSTNNNGQASIDLNLPVGTHVITSTVGNVSVSSKAIVKSTIFSSDYSGSFLNARVDATFTDSNGELLKNTQVTFKVANQEFAAVTDAYGYAFADVNLDVGKYDVTLINTISGEQKQSRLDISKANSTIIFASSQNGDILKLTAEMSSPAATGYVIFTIGLENIRADLENGAAGIELDNLAIGTYDVTVTYSGDANFYASTVQKSVTLSETVIVLAADDVTQYYGEMKTFDVFLTQNGLPLADVRVTISIGGETLPAKTDSNGKAYVLISKDVGVYDVISKYGNCSISNKLTVKSTIDANDAVCEYSNASISAAFLDYYGNALKDRKVKFVIGSQEFEQTTDSKGYACVDVDLNQGTYDVIVVNTVSSERKQIRLTVTKANPAISLSSHQIANVLNLTARLPLAATGNVTFNINLNDYHIPVENGVAGVLIADLPAKTYAVTATYSGDGNFNANTARDSVTIRNDINLTAGDVVQYYGQSKKFEVVLTQNGAALANVNVAITIDGNTRYAKTDSGGRAYVIIDNEVGVYDVISQYGDTSVSNKLTVKSTIDAADASGEYMKSSVGATFIDSDGNVLKLKSVSFTIDGREFDALTDADGYAAAAVDLTPGTYDVEVYNAQSGERKHVRLTVSKAASSTELSISQNDVEVVLTASLTPAAATGKVTFNVAGKTYTAYLNNGKATVTVKGLDVGSYRATASYGGDDNVLSSKSNSLSFSVAEPRAVLHANDTTMIYGSDDEFTIDITDSYGNPLKKDINISFDGNNTNMTIHMYRNYKAHTGADGRVVFNSTELVPGTYDVTVKSENSDEVRVKLIVRQPPLVVSAESSSIYYGDDEGFILTLRDANGNLLSDTWFWIAFRGSGYVYDLLCTDGKGRVAFSSDALKPDTYETTIYCGDYEDAVLNLTVKSTIAAADLSTTYPNSRLTATFLDINGRALALKQVTFRIGDRTYSAATDSNGAATADAGAVPGTYDVTAINPSSGEEKQFKLTVLKAASTTSITSSQNDGAVTLTAAVAPSSATGRVTFAVGSRTYTANVENGKASVTVSDLDSGTYQATASYSGDGNYLSSKSSSVSFAVEKIASAITAGDVTKKQAGPEKLTFTLNDAQGNAIGDANVNVDLNGDVKTLKTDGKGQASMDIDLGVGIYAAAITFAGNGKYAGASKTVHVTVEKKVLTLTAGSVSTVYGNVKYIVVNLKDSYDSPQANVKISFDLDGQRYVYWGDTYTDENGQAKISSGGIVPDTYAVTISADGCSSVKTKMTISKATPKITAAKKTFKVKTKTKKYTITLKNNLGKVMKSTKVKLTVKGKTYTAKTNSKGKATFKITKLTKKGKYTAVVKYAGSAYYKAVSKKVKITVKK